MSKISAKGKKRIKTRLKHTKDIDEYKRLCVILAWDRGREVVEIADLLNLPESTVYRYIKEYTEKSKTHNEPKGGSPPKLAQEQEEELINYLQETTYLYAKQICGYVLIKYGVKYSVSGMKDWLARHGFVYKKPKKVPGKLDPEQQKQFIKGYEELKKSLKKDEEIYFADAVHPQHQSEALCGWIKRGEKKTLQTTGKQLRLHFVGAINLTKMKCVTQEYKTVDTEAMIDFFKKLEASSQASRIYVILDNARANKNKKLDEFLKGSRIKPCYLPPYSPNLNAIERLWKVLREQIVYNRYYESCIVFFDAVRGFFAKTVPKLLPELRPRINDKFQAIVLNPVKCAFSL